MAALRAREQTGRGQVVDTSLVEPLLTLLGPQLTAFDLLGELQPRTGNRSSHNAPRNLYRTADGSWVAVSSSATSIAARVLELVGRPDLAQEPWFATGSGRAEHVDEIDDAVAAWIRERDRDDVMAAFETAGCAIAPVYDASDVLADPQLEALGSISTVEDLQLGPLRMPNVISRLSETPGQIRHTGGRHGADTAAVFAELGVKADELGDAPGRPGRMTAVPPLTWLYVPADRPDRVEKAIASRAHAVIVDLEDGVAPGAKEEARAGLAGLLSERRRKPVYVRVNAGDAADLEAVAVLADQRDRRAEGRPARGRARDAASGQLPDRVGRGTRGRLCDRVDARASPGSRSASPISAPRRARSRRGSTGPAAGSSMPPSPPACRGRRSRSIRTSATRTGSPARAPAAASSATSAAPRSIPTSCP